MANNLVLMMLFVLSYSFHLSSEDEGNNTSQPICPNSFSCSNLDDLSFPFYTSNNSACGLCEVNCDEVVPKIKLKEDYPFYDLVQVQPGSSVTIQVRDTYFANQINTNSCDSFMNSFPPNSTSISYSIYPTISILRCAKSSQLRAQVDEYFGKEGEYYSFERCTDYSYYYTYSSGYVSDNPNIPPLCSVVVLPGNSLSTLSKEADFKNLFNILTSEVNFVLQVSDDCQKCHTRGGKCSDENQSFRCEYNIRNTKKEKPRNIVIKSALATFGTGAAIISILVVLFFRFKKSSRYNMENYNNVEAFIKNHESLAPKRYTYSDVRKMTDSFKVKVGEGGYGSVYQGTLPN
ncbi:hypothetical protein Tco_0853323, partial [Tanacetum coccineum]